MARMAGKSRLVITRNVGQAVLIGTGPDQVRVEVVEPRNGGVRLRFVAPTRIVINREEVAAEIQREKMAEKGLPPAARGRV